MSWQKSFRWRNSLAIGLSIATTGGIALWYSFPETTPPEKHKMIAAPEVVFVWPPAPPPPPEPPGTPSCDSPAPTPETLSTMLLLQAIHGAANNIALCVGVDGKDPPPSILAALQAKSRIVVRYSECVAKMSGSYQKKTHRSAILVSVEGFCPTMPESADIDVDLYHDGLWAIFKKMEVRKSGDTWVVVRVKLHSEA